MRQLVCIWLLFLTIMDLMSNLSDITIANNIQRIIVFRTYVYRVCVLIFSSIQYENLHLIDLKVI